jgi:hypothetical protein
MRLMAEGFLFVSSAVCFESDSLFAFSMGS